MRDRALWGRQLNDADREGGDGGKGVNLDDDRGVEKRCERHETSDRSCSLDRQPSALTKGGDEKDGALAAAFAAGIIGRLGAGPHPNPPPCPRRAVRGIGGGCEAAILRN